MADIQKLNVNGNTYDISTTWEKVTGKPNYYEFSTQRDFGSGTLIKTNINYDVTNGDPFYGEIKGNTYDKGLNSCFTQFQGYIYANTIISYGVTHLGCLHITPITAMNIGGKLCFWFPRLGYWMGFSSKVTTGYNYSINRVTSVIHSAEPSGTKKVVLTSSTVYNINSQNIASQSVNYATNAGSSSNVPWSGVTGKPTIPTNTNQLTNGAGFITGITKSMVTTALGYTPPTSDTNTWRPVTNTYTGSDQSTCVSQYGTNALYNALVNGYASSAGSATYASRLGDSRAYYTKSSLDTALAGKAASSHTHTKSQITDFPSSMPASDVYSWAKASTKPTYNFGEIGPGIATIGDGANRLMFRTNASYASGMYVL